MKTKFKTMNTAGKLTIITAASILSNRHSFDCVEFLQALNEVAEKNVLRKSDLNKIVNIGLPIRKNIDSKKLDQGHYTYEKFICFLLEVAFLNMTTDEMRYFHINTIAAKNPAGSELNTWRIQFADSEVENDVKIVLPKAVKLGLRIYADKINFPADILLYVINNIRTDVMLDPFKLMPLISNGFDFINIDTDKIVAGEMSVTKFVNALMLHVFHDTTEDEYKQYSKKKIQIEKDNSFGVRWKLVPIKEKKEKDPAITYVEFYKNFKKKNIFIGAKAFDVLRNKKVKFEEKHIKQYLIDPVGFIERYKIPAKIKDVKIDGSCKL